MRRDTYADHFTGMDIVQDVGAVIDRVCALAKRSGMCNVWNVRFEHSRAWNQDAMQMEVVFLSKGWTGR